MTYYFIHPSKPQFFFPKDFKKYTIMRSFFKPYSFVGFISWLLFRNSGLYRNFFSLDSIEDYIPENEIRLIVGHEAIMAFNMGTVGPEQKITALGVLKEQSFFIKYARTYISKENVLNEHHILKQLSKLNYVPQIITFYQNESHVLLKTSVLEGKRMGYTKIQKNILDRIIELGDLKLDSLKSFKGSFESSFAHGDFCPWNLMTSNSQILIYDWEFAGEYPLGYDLFTFIFQTNFLLKPKKNIETIITENKDSILTYFQNKQISDWKRYLIEFARLKIELELKKGTNKMISNYKILLDYAEKA